MVGRIIIALGLIVGCTRTSSQPAETAQPPTAGQPTTPTAAPKAPDAATATTLAALLGDAADPRRLGFQRDRQLLGAQHDDFIKEFPEYVADPDATFKDTQGDEIRFGWIVLPPTEYTENETRIRVTFGSYGELKKAQLTIPVRTPADKAAVLAVLKAKWGEGKLEADKLVKTYELRARDPQVMLEDRDQTSAPFLTLELFLR